MSENSEQEQIFVSAEEAKKFGFVVDGQTTIHVPTFAETWPHLAEYENLPVMEMLNQIAKRIKYLEHIAEMNGWVVPEPERGGPR